MWTVSPEDGLNRHRRADQGHRRRHAEAVRVSSTMGRLWRRSIPLACM
jgi:hypothetical protein